MAGSYSEDHPILVDENRPDMQTRNGGGYDPAVDGGGMHVPDPDTIRGAALATMSAEQAAFINLGLKVG